MTSSTRSYRRRTEGAASHHQAFSRRPASTGKPPNKSAQASPLASASRSRRDGAMRADEARPTADRHERQLSGFEMGQIDAGVRDVNVSAVPRKTTGVSSGTAGDQYPPAVLPFALLMRYRDSGGLGTEPLRAQSHFFGSSPPAQAMNIQFLPSFIRMSV